MFGTQDRLNKHLSLAIINIVAQVLASRGNRLKTTAEEWNTDRH